MLDLSTLNPPQREAVTTLDGPLLVLAGAGSGKTRVIAHRVAWLLVKGADPARILAVTFTNKAAEEMRERVTSLAGAPGVDVFVSTFHSFGRHFLKEEHEAAGLPRRFTICDAADQLTVVKKCMKEVKVDDRAFDAKRVLAIISKAKNALSAIKLKGEGQGDDYDVIGAEVMPRYEQALRSQRAVDFDDLIVLPVKLMKKHAGLRARWQARFDHLLIDEYQDTNKCQLELAKLLAGAARSICAVGDDDQAIYGWRGAEVKNILRFDRHFPGVKEVRLEQNYRSTGRVLACANAVIAQNPDRKAKKLWTAGGAGAKVRQAALATDEDEAAFVANEIVRLRREGRPLSHFAVLYRLNAQARPVEEALREVGVEYHLHGGRSFFDRSEVKDLLAYLKACVNRDDDVALARIVNTPPRGIGEVAMEKLGDWALHHGVGLFAALEASPNVPGLPRGAAERMVAFAQQLRTWTSWFDEEKEAAGRMTMAAAAKRLCAELDLYGHARASVASVEAGLRKVDALDSVLRMVESYERRDKRASLETWLARIALDTRDEEPEEGPGVTLMTFHAAKGLEWPVVFMVGCEEGLLPSGGIQGEARDLAEERRLAYVGITRAREELYLSRALARLRRGKLEPRTPSRFLADLPADSAEAYDPSAVPAPAEQVAARSAEVLAKLRALREASSAPADVPKP